MSSSGRMVAFASVVALAGPALVSCESSPTEGASLPPSAPVVSVVADEYSFDVKGPLPAGRVVFRIFNAGTETHDPGLVALDEDVPPVNVYVRQTERPPIAAFAGGNPRQPGATGTFAADLEPGKRYALVCFMLGPDGKRHSEKGMTWEARAGAPPPAQEPSGP